MKHPVTKIRRRRKEEVVKAFGGRCSICNYNKCLNALHFHHTNPLIKTNNPTEVVSKWSVKRSLEFLKKEKCILVCSNCHAELHSENYDYSKLRNNYKTFITKNCPLCFKQFHYYEKSSKEKKFCSEECSKFSLRKVKRPNYEELKDLLKTHSKNRIGKIFGVSGTAVLKWIKKYESEKIFINKSN